MTRLAYISPLVRRLILRPVSLAAILVGRIPQEIRYGRACAQDVWSQHRRSPSLYAVRPTAMKKLRPYRSSAAKKSRVPLVSDYNTVPHPHPRKGDGTSRSVSRWSQDQARRLPDGSVVRPLTHVLTFCFHPPCSPLGANARSSAKGTHRPTSTHHPRGLALNGGSIHKHLDPLNQPKHGRRDGAGGWLGGGECTVDETPDASWNARTAAVTSPPNQGLKAAYACGSVVQKTRVQLGNVERWLRKAAPRKPKTGPRSHSKKSPFPEDCIEFSIGRTQV